MSAEQMRALIHRYYAACNAGDAAAIAECFVADAVHYFPPGMYGGPFVGAATIGGRWRQAVADLGSRWVLESLVLDPDQHTAVLEWTHYKTKQGTVLRGDEWVCFDAESGLIKEIRAYYASPQTRELTLLELEGFDYAGRGYSVTPPTAKPPGNS